MPLLSKTLQKIKKQIPDDLKQLTTATIKQAFEILVTSYNAQVFSKKKHIIKLRTVQQKLKDSQTLSEMFKTIIRLKSTLVSEKSSFAVQALAPILIALQGYQRFVKITDDEKMISLLKTEDEKPGKPALDTLSTLKPSLIYSTPTDLSSRTPSGSSANATILEPESPVSRSTLPSAIAIPSGGVSEGKQTQAAIRIQQRFRTFIAQKKYRVTHLTPTEQASYLAFVVGNDPLIKGLDKYKQNPDDKEPIAVIGTSGLRSIEIGLELSNSTLLPKVIIVDNSQQVVALWGGLRKFTATCPSEDYFFKALPGFLGAHKHLYRNLEDAQPEPGYPSQKIIAYLEDLSKKYGFQNLIKVITATTVIKQHWGNLATFQKLKASLQQLGILKIYAYPSNIVSCMDSHAEKMAILENIRLLAPELVIHTDLSLQGYPEKVFLLEDADPKKAIDALSSHAPSVFRLPFASGQDLSSILPLLLSLARHETPPSSAPGDDVKSASSGLKEPEALKSKPQKTLTSSSSIKSDKKGFLNSNSSFALNLKRGLERQARREALQSCEAHI